MDIAALIDPQQKINNKYLENKFLLWYNLNIDNKGEMIMSKKQDKRKIATRIIAAVLAVLMVLGMCAGLIYQLLGR